MASLNAPSRTMAVPFSIDASGSVAFVIDPNQQLLDRVTAIVATDLTERVMDPAFGVALRSSLFKAFTDEDATLLRTEIQAAIAAYEPGITVDVVEPVLDQANGMVAITVYFTSSVAGQIGPAQVIIPVGG